MYNLASRLTPSGATLSNQDEAMVSRMEVVSPSGSSVRGVGCRGSSSAGAFQCNF